jgi:glycosyltransferase involved in cell wall biosynthesis
MKRIVVSAVNFSEGGPLTVLRSCLTTARAKLPASCEIVALVHNRELIDIEGIRLIEFPDSKKSWLRRLRHEYWDFKTLSRKLKPDFWLSLHDMSPRLNGERQAVYCHNPAPFFQPTLRDGKFEPSLIAFRFFYHLIYRFNIQSNDCVIVQQQWLRHEFESRFQAPNVIVAYPDTTDLRSQQSERRDDGKFVIFYPAIPRAFKNIETLCRAMAALAGESDRPVELHITINGSENSYARSIKEEFGAVPGIKFIGRQNREGMARNYSACDLVVFPSRLETWGLPISEAKTFGLPIMAADLPYAHETVGNYDRVAFLPALDSAAWGEAILAASKGIFPYKPAMSAEPPAPFAQNWDALWDHLLEPVPQ